VDEQPCWSVSCLFIAKSYRKQGVSIELLRAAVAHAKQQGAKIVEGYPVEPKSEKDFPPAFAWNGILSAFIAAGFTEVARRSTTRPLMRITLSQDCSREL
jgi:GNAT superfamily N-acetyltransferase